MRPPGTLKLVEVRIGHELHRSPEEKNRLEGENCVLQFREVVRLSQRFDRVLALTPAIVCELHRLAIQGLYTCAGRTRDWPVRIEGAAHRPPEHRFVKDLIAQMCEQANEATDWEPVRTAAYLVWRLNWIHPFGGGNGRTARAVAYLGLCTRLGFIPPGAPAIPELLKAERARYQDALQEADMAWKDQVLDLGRMETLMEELLIRQLESRRPEADI